MKLGGPSWVIVAMVALHASWPLAAQANHSISLALGWGVDTARSPERDIVRLWQAYLADRPDSNHPSPHWSASEQAEFPDFDLLRGYVYQGFPAWTVVQLTPAPGADSTYVLRTLVAGTYDSGKAVKPLALFRVYAVRENGRWVLGNAFLRLTRDWPRETLGSVTFVYPPSYHFDRSRARASARFVDSLAAAFGLPAPSGVRYYVTHDVEEMFRVMGLDYFPSGHDTAGGRSSAVDRLVFSGFSKLGEGYRHELAHLVFWPMTRVGHTHWLVSEGLATWTGGAAGLDFDGLLPGLARYVRAHPDVSLESIASDPPPREGTLDVGYDGFAVLCEMVFKKGGVQAVKSLVAAGTSVDEVLGTAARLLGLGRGDLDAAWRRRVLGILTP